MVSRSKSSSKTTTQQTDNRVGADGGAVAIGSGARVNIDMDSPEAFEVAGALVDVAGQGFAEAVDFARFTQQEQQKQNEKVLDTLAAARDSESSGLVGLALKYAVPVALVAVAVRGMKK